MIKELTTHLHVDGLGGVGLGDATGQSVGLVHVLRLDVKWEIGG